MTTNRPEGVLAIWNDVRNGHDSEFNWWYNYEHLPERISVPGFKCGRRYEAVAGRPSYFCYYVTESPEVLLSPAYVARLNNPTPLTRKVMSEAFADMIRTACRRDRSWYRLTGSYCVTGRFSGKGFEGSLGSVGEALLRNPGVARCQIWSALDDQGTVRTEEQLRGGDLKIASCITVDTFRFNEAEQVQAQLVSEFRRDVEVGIYRLLCQIQ